MLSLTLAGALLCQAPTQPKPTVLIGTVVKKSDNRGVIMRTQTKAGAPANVLLAYDGSIKQIRRLREGQLVRVEGNKPVAADSKKYSAEMSVRKLDFIRLTWNAALRDKAVAGGTVQTFHVDGVMRNSGTVAMSGSLDVRLYQISSPNDWTKSIDFKIGAKRTEKFTVPFKIYNFEYIGATSIPRIEIGVSDLEVAGVED